MNLKETYDKYVEDGFITSVRQGGLTLYKYSVKTVQEDFWDTITTNARGLILNDVGVVCGRGFPKFHNINQRPETKIEVLPQETPELADKLDGSCIITFFNPETSKWQAVTLGCWDNIQTQFANKWLESNASKLDKDYSYIFELTAFWNRIVIAYPDEKMTLIGIIKTETGEDWSYQQIADFAAERGLESVKFWTRPVSEVNLEDQVFNNQEGYVARFSNGFRVKLKYKSYMHLHKILTGLSVKGIWESLSTNVPIVLENIPDEFMSWFLNEKNKLQNEFKKYEEEARAIFASVPKCETRKEYASHFTKHGQLTPVLFNILDGHDFSNLLWKRVRPVGHKVFKVDQE